MPAPKVPAGLPADRVQAYHDLYDALGQQAADEFAAGFGATPTPPAPTAAPITPPMMSVPPLQIVAGPGGRPTVVPIGAEPPPVAAPPMREQLQDRPGIPKLSMTQDELAQAAITLRTQANEKRGMSREDALKEAQEYVDKARATPRTIEFRPKGVPGYSELAVRGEELLPKMTAGEATIEAIKPQVIETEAQAEGRRRFEQARRKAKADIEAQAKATNKTPQQIADDIRIGNSIRAEQIARLQASDRGESQVLMKDIQEIEAALNAPYYAAIDELRGTPPADLVSKWASDTLRGLTQEERYGRLVETRGAAVLRNVGGLTRYGIKAMEDYIVEPVVAGVVAGLDPNVTYGDLMQSEKEAIEAAGGARRVVGPGVTYEKGAEARNKIETGSFLKDVAYEVATGRSAIDDYIDAGAPTGVATVLGLVTEIGLPATPLGYVTDVAAPLVRGAARIPVVGAPLRFAGEGLSLLGDLPEATRLQRFINEQVKTSKDLGRAMDSPRFWDTWKDVSEARKSLAVKIANDSADLAATTKALRKPADISKVANRVADIIEGVEQGGATTRRIASDLWDRIIKPGGIDEGDFIAALRSGDASLLDEVRSVTSKVVNTNSAAAKSTDIIRNSFARAMKTVNDFGDNTDDVVRVAIAETLEKVPTSKYMFITPRLLIKTELAADKTFQKTVADAVKALPPESGIDDVSRAVEKVIKQNYTGADLAEAAAVRPPRDEGLLPQAPRGGLERLATPAARRVPLYPVGGSVVQDIRDTVKAIVVPKSKMITETFAGSQQLGAISRTVDNALQARIPTEVRDFLTATKSEIDALTITRVPTRTPRPLVPGAAQPSEGVLLDALRAQGDDSLNTYLTARIEADAENPTSLKASTVKGPVGTKGWDEINMTAKKAAVSSIVRSFFKEGINTLTDPTVAATLNKVIGESVEASPDAMTAVADAISSLRSNFPELYKAGRRGIGVDFTADDISSAVLDHIIKQEAKAIFADNFYRYFPELRFNPQDSIDSLRSSMLNNIDATPGIDDAIKDRARQIVNDFTRVDVNNQELVEASIKIANMRFANDALDFARPASFSGWGTNTRKMIQDINALGEPTLTTRVISSVGEFTKPHTDALIDFLYQNKVIRPVTETDVAVIVADDLAIPMPRTQKQLIEELIGPLGNLSKGNTAIADNLSAIYRSPSSGLGDTFSTLFKSFVDTIRTLSVPGLTAGVVLPNVKFHAINYFGAPLVMSVTAPGSALWATLGEASRFVPFAKSWRETNLNFVKDMAKTNPTDIAFTSANGIPYTYKQLDDYMNQNYFGMTNEVFAFGNKFGEDVRIELGLDHSGTPARGLDAKKDAVQRYLNFAGMNQYVRVASSIDTAWRQQAFLAALKSGETVESARAIAKNAVLDYGRIPSSLKTAASRYMTFFSWFAVSNAEIFSALFRPAAAANISKMVRAQRELHKGFGEWQYSDDGMKKRMFSFTIGEYDDLPVHFVGPENPWAGPLIDQVAIATGLASIVTGGTSPAQGFEAFSNAIVDKSFTPFLGYLSDIGALGETGALSKVVPARQVSFHQAMGPEHFAHWLQSNNITTVPIDERRLGEPTFYGQQYMYADETARRKAAFWDLVFVVAGLNRAINDYQQLGLITGATRPAGVDLKRFENTGLGVLQYFTGGNLQKGTTEHEAVRNAIVRTNQELRSMGEK